MLLTHRACQEQCAPHAVERLAPLAHTPFMPRRKKIKLGFEGDIIPADKLSRNPTFIRNWRKFRDMTQEELADRIGIDRTTVGRIETRDLPYNQDFLERVASVLGCEPVDLLYNDPIRPDPPWIVYSRLRDATPALQRQAIAVLDAMLKAG